MDINRAFGMALKLTRLSKKLTQEDFSEVSSRTYISTLERAKFSPTIEKVDVIASHIGIHPISLMALTYIIKNEKVSKDELLKLIADEISNIS